VGFFCRALGYDRSPSLRSQHGSLEVGGPPRRTRRDGPPQLGRSTGNVGGRFVERPSRCSWSGSRTARASGSPVTATILESTSSDRCRGATRSSGPSRLLIPFADECHAIRISTDSQYGCPARSGRVDGGRRCALRERSNGRASINLPLSRAALAPSGGLKPSGFGRISGSRTRGLNSEMKNVYYSTEDKCQTSRRQGGRVITRARAAAIGADTAQLSRRRARASSSRTVE